tara:strand:+ start:2176 stop:3624 length:1449 start_codon:yes stop_codon:yes gene_type:complete
MSRIKAGINIAKAGKTKISELVKKLKQRKYAKKHRKNLEKAGRSAKSVSRYNIRAADQNVTVIPTKGQSQKGSSFSTHKVRGTGPGSRIGFESRASWRDEMDRMFGEIPIETFFKKKSKGGINIVMNKKFPNRGMGLQDEKIQPGKVIKAKRGKFGSGLDFPVINKVKINKKSLHKNLMTTKNPYSTLVKETEKGPKSFIERRKELGGRALRAAKATKYGKIAAGVAGVGLAAKAYLNKKLEEAKAKRKKMGGGIMKKYNKGGGADTGTVGEIRSKQGVIYNKVKRQIKNEPDGTYTIGKKDALKKIKGMAEKAMNRKHIQKVLDFEKSFAQGRRELFKSTAGKNIPAIMGGGMIKRYNTGGGADSAEKRDIRKTESMIGDSISSKREQGRKDASYSRPKEVDNIIKAGQRDAGKRIKPKKAALGLMLMSKKGRENKKAMPIGMGLTAAKADAIKKILGMRTGKMVKARGCKLGRNKSTKII